MVPKRRINLFFLIFLTAPSMVFSGTDSTAGRDTSQRVQTSPDPYAFVYDTTGPGQVIIKDSPIVAMLDSLVNIRYFTGKPFITDTAEMNVHGFPPEQIPDYPDSVYEDRIRTLNFYTPIELVFNRPVKNFIHLYAAKKRDLTSRMLGLSRLYFPMIEEQLDRHGLPLELKYLAVVESALNPVAGSHAGAKGIWQFMYGTGKVYGLKVTSFTDDRYDPLKSTIAACEHLRDLYAIYGDWSLAMAAYNSGAGNVNKAIRRAGGVKSYWAVWPFLPRETRGYVPAFIAVTYVMNHAADHNLYPVDPGILYNGIDSLTVKEVLSFDQIHEMLKIPMEDIKFLNPSFKKGFIPVTESKQYTLWLPREYIGDFINNEQELYNYKTTKGIEKEKLRAEIKKAKERTIHVVRYGENLGLIAKKYHVYVSQIRAWNNLHGSLIRPGQRLIVYPSAPYNRPVTHASSSVSGSSGGSQVVRSGDTQYVYHTVRRGDTLWDIARMYDGVTVSHIKQLNHITNAKRLKPGQKIKVRVKTS